MYDLFVFHCDELWSRRCVLQAEKSTETLFRHFISDVRMMEKHPETY